MDYQPLVDKVVARISSWTVGHLSFAGRLQLIQSILFSLINFWTAIFPQLKKCLEKFEKICNAFLWSGAPSSARGAKVSWKSLCSPKEEGRLGLRKLQDTSQVFGLKLIWLLFASNGSLWVAWIQKLLIRGGRFWSTDFHYSGSWIWRCLMKLRPLARPFLSAHIKSGRSTLFWHDDWSDLGPLNDLIGPNRPRVSGIPNLAMVSDACTTTSWRV